MNIAKPGDTRRRRIAAVGMWDGVHLGHRFLIDFVRREALSRGLIASVVTFQAHPLTIVRPDAAPPLLTDTATRLALLDAAGAEDCVLLDFDDRMRHMTATEFLSMLKQSYGIDTLVVGFNNRVGHDRAEGFEAYTAIGRTIGMEIVKAPEFRHKRHTVSSSTVRMCLNEGNAAKARELLGRPFMIEGTVVHGRQIGRQIGFPTANIDIGNQSLITPANGVYAAVARTPDGVRRRAIVNIGRRPTVDRPDAPVTIEAHILDFAGDLYGQPVALEFFKLMRHEEAFDSLEALKKRLASDRRRAIRLLRDL